MTSWDSQLKSMLHESLTISTTQGNDQAEDSVSVTASGPQAQDIIALLRNAGVGGMGGAQEAEEQQFSNYGLPMSGEDDNALVVVGEPEAQDDGDMLSMMKKMAGLSDHSEGSDDYADEESSDEAQCEACGMNETGCKCDEEIVDETFPTNPMQGTQQAPNAMQQAPAPGAVQSMTAASAPQQPTTGATQVQQVAKEDETMDQREEEVAEDATDGDDEMGREDDLDESLANSADDQADQDLDFMINTISGGLNGRKTMHKYGYQNGDNPLAMKENRLGSPMKESTDLLSDFRKLSGLK
jgi:hypothetical protein